MAFTDRVRIAFRSAREFDFFEIVRFFTRVADVFGFVALGDARFREFDESVLGELSDDDPFGVVSLDVRGDVARVIVVV